MSTKKLFFIGFHNGFNPNDNWINSNFFKLSKTNFIVVNTIEECDILLVGSFIDDNHYTIVNNCKKPRILFVSEPLGYWYPVATKLLMDNTVECLTCCITDGSFNRNNRQTKSIKFSLYLEIFDYRQRINDKSIFEHVNDYVKECVVTNQLCSKLSSKRFCSLINRHDAGQTRINVFTLLNSIKKVDCPSALFHNYPNEELEKLGNVEFIKQYIYNICPENFKCQFDGYITEKLMRACLGGAIPIYAGHFDDVDAKIFNPKRILFYDPSDLKSIQKIYTTVQLFESKPDLLKFFYSQPVFLPTAFETIETMCQNLANWIDDN
jgi:hypothetical protein